MEETVSCLICGHTAVSLARHFKAVHSMTADEYRALHPGARIRSEACEFKRSQATAKSHKDKSRKGLKKTIECPTCGAPREVGLTFAPSMHEARCSVCLQKEDDEKWASLVEGEDYVQCLGCDYRAESLASHLQNEHPEWVGCYPGQATALKSAIRDKTSLKGRTLSEETREKMSTNAGRWNDGLTKETDVRVAAQAEHRKGYESWSKGHTKETHPSLQSTSRKLQKYRGEERPWSNGLKASLEQVDFTPYLDETGAVDRKTMSEELGISEPTITKYMEGVGLRLSTKYVDARAERATIRLEREDLLPFAMGNGKVVVARAMLTLGRDIKVIKRECERHGLPMFSHKIRQTLCLNAVSLVLDSVFVEEWKSWKYVNPISGHRFRFDGYFPDFNLVVEFHGYQHWTFPSVYIQKRELFDAMCERDRLKREMVEADGALHYLELREDEPYADLDYIRARLLDIGLFD